MVWPQQLRLVLGHVMMMDADYDGFHDNDEGEEDDNDENWVYLYNANLSPGVCLEKRRQK